MKTSYTYLKYLLNLITDFKRAFCISFLLFYGRRKLPERFGNVFLLVKASGFKLFPTYSSWKIFLCKNVPISKNTFSTFNLLR